MAMYKVIRSLQAADACNHGRAFKVKTARPISCKRQSQKPGIFDRKKCVHLGIVDIKKKPHPACTVAIWWPIQHTY
jgi:hypothetical protein